MPRRPSRRAGSTGSISFDVVHQSGDVTFELALGGVWASSQLKCRACAPVVATAAMSWRAAGATWSARAERSAQLAMDDTVTVEDRLTAGVVLPEQGYALRASAFAALTRTTGAPALQLTGGGAVGVDVALPEKVQLAVDASLARSYYGRLDGDPAPAPEARRPGHGEARAHVRGPAAARLALAQVRVDRGRRVAALGDRPHDQRGAAAGVAGAEHAGHVRRERAVDARRCRATSSATPSCCDERRRVGAGEAEREDQRDRTACAARCRAGRRAGRRSSSTRTPCSATSRPPSPSRCVVRNANSRAPPSSCELDVRNTSGHAGHGFARRARVRRRRHQLDLRDRRRALAQRGAEAVGAGVAAAEDDHALAARRRATAPARSPPTDLVLLDEVVHREQHAGELAARHVELARALRADRDHARRRARRAAASHVGSRPTATPRRSSTPSASSIASRRSITCFSSLKSGMP